MDNSAKPRFKASLEMKIMRADGTVEYREEKASSILEDMTPEEAMKAFEHDAGFVSWLKKALKAEVRKETNGR